MCWRGSDLSKLQNCDLFPPPQFFSWSSVCPSFFFFFSFLITNALQTAPGRLVESYSLPKPITDRLVRLQQGFHIPVLQNQRTHLILIRYLHVSYQASYYFKSTVRSGVGTGAWHLCSITSIQNPKNPNTATTTTTDAEPLANQCSGRLWRVGGQEG